MVDHNRNDNVMMMTTMKSSSTATAIPTADSTKELPKKKTRRQLQKEKEADRHRKIENEILLHEQSEEQSEQQQLAKELSLSSSTIGLVGGAVETSSSSSSSSSTKPTATTTKNGTTTTTTSSTELSSSTSTTTTTSGSNSSSGAAGGATKAMTGKQVAKDESRIKKILVRIISGACLIGIFAGSVYMGHFYVCLIVAFCQVLLFRELVKVRYHAHFNTIENRIPLFRTTQWLWFIVAIIYTYGDFITEIIQNNQQLHYILYKNPLFITSFAPFILYSGTFVLTIATMQVGLIKFQLNQLCWTIVVLCLTVGQMKYIMHNIFNGLFWFCLPILLVVTNDIMAYVSGITCGRKFISRKFISFSPNKTWEGFIGGGICTIIISWYLSRHLAQYSWMYCPTNEFRFFVPTDFQLTCDKHHVFDNAQSVFPPQIFEIFPPSLVKMIPGIVEICSVKNNDDDNSTESSSVLIESGGKQILTRCISGEVTHIFHHFELVLKNVYPIQIHAVWLALFASLVAPFGGFLASAIKRAYGIKDFDSIIPGHGGVMDRMDCQFLMALCTWVHYNTFVKLATVSVPKLFYMYSLLTENEKLDFLTQLLLQEHNHLLLNVKDMTTTTATATAATTAATAAPSTVQTIRQAAEAAILKTTTIAATTNTCS